MYFEWINETMSKCSLFKKKKAGGGLLRMEGDSGPTGGELVGKKVSL